MHEPLFPQKVERYTKNEFLKHIPEECQYLWEPEQLRNVRLRSAPQLFLNDENAVGRICLSTDNIWHMYNRMGDIARFQIESPLSLTCASYPIGPNMNIHFQPYLYTLLNGNVNQLDLIRRMTHDRPGFLRTNSFKRLGLRHENREIMQLQRDAGIAFTSNDSHEFQKAAVKKYFLIDYHGFVPVAEKFRQEYAYTCVRLRNTCHAYRVPPIKRQHYPCTVDKKEVASDNEPEVVSDGEPDRLTVEGILDDHRPGSNDDILHPPCAPALSVISLIPRSRMVTSDLIPSKLVTETVLREDHLREKMEAVGDRLFNRGAS